MGVSGLQLPFRRSRLPSPAAIIRHFILTDPIVRGASSVPGSPAQSAGIRFRPSVTIAGGGLPGRTVEVRPDLNPPGGSRPVPVATSNTLRVLEVAERIMCSSEGLILVPPNALVTLCLVVKVIHLIDYDFGPGYSTTLVLRSLCIFYFAVPKKKEEGPALAVATVWKRGSSTALILTRNHVHVKGEALFR